MIQRVVAMALPLALLTVSIALIAVVGAWLRLLPPLPALGLFALALLGGGGLTVLVGLVGVVRGGDARGMALVATVVGALCIGLLAVLVLQARGAPPIHDITTDFEEPPQFRAATRAAENQGRDLTYPNGAATSAEQQRAAYPDLDSIEVDAAPAEAFASVLRVAEELGWTVVEQDGAAGVLEATDETAVFGFVDDIVVRVRPTGTGAIIDARSLSRLGVGDLGANAARIRAMRDALLTGRR